MTETIIVETVLSSEDEAGPVEPSPYEVSTPKTPSQRRKLRKVKVSAGSDDEYDDAKPKKPKSEKKKNGIKVKNPKSEKLSSSKVTKPKSEKLKGKVEKPKNEKKLKCKKTPSTSKGREEPERRGLAASRSMPMERREKRVSKPSVETVSSSDEESDDEPVRRSSKRISMFPGLNRDEAEPKKPMSKQNLSNSSKKSSSEKRLSSMDEKIPESPKVKKPKSDKLDGSIKKGREEPEKRGVSASRSMPMAPRRSVAKVETVYSSDEESSDDGEDDDAMTMFRPSGGVDDDESDGEKPDIPTQVGSPPPAKNDNKKPQTPPPPEPSPKVRNPKAVKNKMKSPTIQSKKAAPSPSKVRDRKNATKQSDSKEPTRRGASREPLARRGASREPKRRAASREPPPRRRSGSNEGLNNRASTRNSENSKDIKNKLSKLEAKLAQAEKERDHERVSDLKYGAIPDMKEKLERVLKEEKKKGSDSDEEDPSSSGSGSGSEDHRKESSKDIRRKITTLKAKLAKAEKGGDKERVADLKFGALPDLEAHLERVLKREEQNKGPSIEKLEEKLASLEAKLAQAEKSGDYERAGDLKFGAIPDIKAQLDQLSKEEGKGNPRSSSKDRILNPASRNARPPPTRRGVGRSHTGERKPATSRRQAAAPASGANDSGDMLSPGGRAPPARRGIGRSRTGELVRPKRNNSDDLDLPSMQRQTTAPVESEGGRRPPARRGVGRSRTGGAELGTMKSGSRRPPPQMRRGDKKASQ